MSLPLILTVETQQHAYPIVIGADIGSFGLNKYIKSKQILIVSNETVAPLYLEKIKACLVGFEVQTCILPDGERYKTQESINAIYDVLMTHHFGRDCTLIALGGGVIGDMTGFAAASFMRGVDFIQIPTTLLSQVDSSVGGKTGINHALGKNMIGAFWQPVAVFIDMTMLATLPKREFSAGMAEVVKYACIMDRDFLDWLIAHKDAIMAQDVDILAQMVYRSCAYKAKIVGMDEKEQGVRAYLNFGHTFGHAIETYMGYGNWLHGEAVAVGMVQAGGLSYLEGRLSYDEYQQLIQSLQAFDLPVQAPDIPLADALDLMGHDKKVKAGKMRFVLLNGLGNAVVTDHFDANALQTVLTIPYHQLQGRP